MNKINTPNQYQGFIKEIEKLARINDEQIPVIPVHDNGEALVSLKSIPGLKFDDPRLKYLAREQILRKLERIMGKLKILDLGLYITDAYRSRSRQKQYWDKSLKDTQTIHPDLDTDQIMKLTARFTAPLERAQHCTGGSIDILLYNLKTNAIIDDFDEADESNFNELVYTDNPLVSKEVRSNRDLLRSAMEAEDFVNYPLEWWHFSFGNAEWAIYKEKPYAVYGLIDVKE